VNSCWEQGTSIAASHPSNDTSISVTSDWNCVCHKLSNSWLCLDIPDVVCWSSKNCVIFMNGLPARVSHEAKFWLPTAHSCQDQVLRGRSLHKISILQKQYISTAPKGNVKWCRDAICLWKQASRSVYPLIVQSASVFLVMFRADNTAHFQPVHSAGGQYTGWSGNPEYLRNDTSIRYSSFTQTIKHIVAITSAPNMTRNTETDCTIRG
jgi:hypothetical protein